MKEITAAQALRPFLESGAFVRLSDDEWLLGWGAMRAEKVQPPSTTAFYVSDFLLTSPRPWRIPDNTMKVSTQALRSAVQMLRPQLAQERAGEWAWRLPSKTAFTRVVTDLKQRFENHELTKAVPVNFEYSPHRPDLISERAFLFEKLLQAPSGVFPYGYWTPDDEAVAGLTPETLFTAKGNELQLMALAGTGAAIDSHGSLLNDSKEWGEHQVVVADLLEQMQPVGEIMQGQTREWSLGRLKHLLTEMKIQLRKSLSFIDLVRALHPTPALGAAPRTTGWKWLQEHERHRGRFGAPFGVFIPGEKSVCLVAIRNIQWNRQGSWLGAGCGIVPASRVDKEWNELTLKRKSVKETLGL